MKVIKYTQSCFATNAHGVSEEKFKAAGFYPVTDESSKHVRRGIAVEIDAPDDVEKAILAAEKAAAAADKALAAAGAAAERAAAAQAAAAAESGTAALREELDAALAELPGTHTDPDYVVGAMRSFYGTIVFTEADEARVRELVKAPGESDSPGVQAGDAAAGGNSAATAQVDDTGAGGPA